MHQTTYGYNIMDQNDPAKGTAGWFAGLNSNWSRMDGHSHNGIDSPPLAASAFPVLTQTIAHAGWVTGDRGDGGYMQTVATPAGVDDVSNFDVCFECTAPTGVLGQRAYLDWIRLGATSMKVYCNDNTADFTILFR